MTPHGTGRYLPAMRQPHSVALDSHAAATLRYIRASMEAAGTVAVSGSAGVTMGAVGLLAAALASSPALRPHWLSVWLIAATVAALAGGVLMARQASRQGSTLFGAPVRDRKSTRLNSSHTVISYAVFCLKKKKKKTNKTQQHHIYNKRLQQKATTCKQN